MNPPTESEDETCPKCGKGPRGLLFDPRPHPEDDRFICCNCDHEWTAESGGASP